MAHNVFTNPFVKCLDSDCKEVGSLTPSKIASGIDEIDYVLRYIDKSKPIQIFTSAVFYYKRGYCLYLIGRKDEAKITLERSERNLILSGRYNQISDSDDYKKLKIYINTLSKIINSERKIESDNRHALCSIIDSDHANKKEFLDVSDFDANDEKNIELSVKKNYNTLISILDKAISNIKNLNLRSDDLTKIKNKFISELNYRKSDIEQKKQDVDNIVWDRLVIAFFGQTNAGKSTIIESLRILLRSNSNNKSKASKIMVQIPEMVKLLVMVEMISPKIITNII
jgi:hypothetical protein